MIDRSIHRTPGLMRAKPCPRVRYERAACPRRTILFLDSNQWLAACVAASAPALCLLPFYNGISLWLGASVFLAGLVVVHLKYASASIVPFPHLAILIALLQCVFAPWLALYYPPADPRYAIGDRMAEYLGYAVPAVLALALGWAAALRGLPLRNHAKHPTAANPHLLGELDALLAIGFLATIIAAFLKQSTLGFLLVLIGNLRYPALFGRILCRAPGWRWRLALALAIEIIFAADEGMFHSLLLFAAWTLAIWMHASPPRWGRLIGVACLAALLLPTIQISKNQLRQHLWASYSPPDSSAVENAVTWVAELSSSTGQLLGGSLDDDVVSDITVRYNQGWIIDRVMQQVPSVQPCARGETLLRAAASALVPRLLAPHKPTAGGRENIERFAGIVLSERTSMNLGFMGEMYANFGRAGGVAGCFGYGLFFGLLCRFVSKRAARSPLWSSLIPYVCFTALKAETGIGPVLNWLTKSVLVLAVVCACAPALRNALGQKPEGRASNK
jgi:hypothetical protein